MDRDSSMRANSEVHSPRLWVDRLIHRAHMVTLKGKSYRLRERGTGAAPAAPPPGGALFAS